MTVDEIRALIAAAAVPGQASAMAIDETGGEVVAMPQELGDLFDDLVDVDFPLDAIHPDSYGPAIANFEACHRSGHSRDRMLRHDGAVVDITIIDARPALGCYVAMLVPADGPLAVADGDDQLLVPRHFSYTSAASGNVLSVDDRFCRRMGWSPEEVVGRSISNLMHPDEMGTSLADWAELMRRPGSEQRIRQRLKASDGSWVWVEATDHNRLSDPDHRDIRTDLVDIGDEMAALEALHSREELLARLTDALPSGVLHLGPDDRVVFTNGPWRSLADVEAGGDPLAGLVAAVHEGELLSTYLGEARRTGVDRDVELMATVGDQVRFLRLRLRPLTEESGTGLLLVLDDITTERKRRDELIDAAERDGLTGLLNRAGMMARLRQWAATDRPLAVLFCDLDRLKLINDTVGHRAGDEAIRQMAAALVESARSDDLVGRVGGDEFLVALTIDEPEQVQAVLDRIAERLVSRSAAFDHDLPPGITTLSASIGVATHRPGETLEQLLERADAAMYEVKQAARLPSDDPTSPRGAS